MKTSLLSILNLMCLLSWCLAQDSMVQITKEKLQVPENYVRSTGKPDSIFRLTRVPGAEKAPDLIIPFYSTVRSRVADVRVSQGRMEVAIQDDEFGIDYYDYRRTTGDWVMQDKKRVCALNGHLSGRIAQVDIAEDGVKVSFHSKWVPRQTASWDSELFEKPHRNSLEQLKTSRYILGDGNFVLADQGNGSPSQSGDVAPPAASNTQKEPGLQDGEPSVEHPTGAVDETASNMRTRTPVTKSEVLPSVAKNQELRSSTPWSVIVVLIVAALGLLCLLLKRRS
jgi:hypothetical protein